MLTNVNVEEARDLLLEVVMPLPAETVPLLQSLRRVTALDLTADNDLPDCPRSAVDGFAVHEADLIGKTGLTILERLKPGEVPSAALTPGKTIGVATGGPLPRGAAAVLPWEATRTENNKLSFSKKIRPGTNIKPQGEDFRRGDMLVRRGTKINPGGVGLLAAFGHSSIEVYRRPRVAIVCLGSEIIPHDTSPQEGQVRDSNGPLLKSLVEQDGGQAIGLSYIGGYQNDSIKEVLHESFRRADLVLTVGGAASGEYDQALALLREAGARMLFWGIQAKTGSHSGGGILRSTAVISLSGNPSACVTGYHLLAAPVLRAMQGLSPGPVVITATCSNSFARGGDTRRFLRGYLECGTEGRQVTILPGQKSSMIKALAGYNALIEIPAGHPPVREGNTVTVYSISN